MTDIETFYLKYGSRLWTAFPDLFYDRVFDDPALSNFFQGASKEYMKDHMESLMHHLVGGPKLYEGRDLSVAHGNLDISEQDFSRLLAHMRAAFEEAGIEPVDAGLIIARVEQEKTKIIGA